MDFPPFASFGRRPLFAKRRLLVEPYPPAFFSFFIFGFPDPLMLFRAAFLNGFGPVGLAVAMGLKKVTPPIEEVNFYGAGRLELSLTSFEFVSLALHREDCSSFCGCPTSGLFFFVPSFSSEALRFLQTGSLCHDLLCWS